MSRQFTRETKRLAWNRSAGRCQRCIVKLTSGNTNYDHVVPYELSFDSSAWNCQVLCNTCHRHKTSMQDVPTIAEAKRRSDFHLGITGPGLGGSPMACGKRSRVSKTFNRGIVPRQSQIEKHRRFMAGRYPEELS
jgi:5-methylcytosine-specific restriction enzyme A